VEPVVYRLAPAVVVQLVGLACVVLALVLFAGTAIVAVAGLPADLLLVVVLVLVAGVFVAGWWLRNRAYVLRATADGYRIGLVRGAGLKEARWSQVEQAVTAVRRDAPCIELRLKDGRTTVIPASVLAVDTATFVQELRGHLQRASGLKRLR
jgi:hypothetical protein